MKLKIKETFEYIPKWNGNKEVDKKDQIKIVFKFFSGEDFTNVIDSEGKTDKLKEWITMCKSVINLEVNDVKITPEGIYNMSGLMDLYVELKLAYRDETIIDKKKLK